MIREIKFRAWDSYNKVMINPVFELREDGHFWGEDFTNTGYMVTDKSHVTQYTGLKDAKGVEIYEGDIVMWGDLKRASEMWHRYAVVELKPDIQLRIICYKHSKTKEVRHSDNYVFHWGRFAYSGNELKIIGNLYENPELLENPTI